VINDVIVRLHGKRSRRVVGIASQVRAEAEGQQEEFPGDEGSEEDAIGAGCGLVEGGHVVGL